MKPKKDPIKPSKVLNKKPNFKKEKLEDEFIKVSLAGCINITTTPVTQPPVELILSSTTRGRLHPLTWVTLNKKKTRWERVKDYFSSIYKRWRHVE